MIRKNILAVVLVIFCLTASLSMIRTTTSQSVREYDPWYDINDDGKIDIKDVYGIELKYGTTGEPINKTQIILDLQNRVNALEEQQNYVKTIRFYTPNETMNDQTSPYKDAAVFVWNPRNATDNAIMTLFVYFQYNTTAYGCELNVRINEQSVLSFGEYEYNTGYEQSQVWVLSTTHFYIMPNQNAYTVKLQLASQFENTPTYVKDINILLGVMDGLPPS